MTMTTTSPRVTYAGTGAQTVFPFTLKVFEDSDVLVTLVASSGLETPLSAGVDFLYSAAGQTVTLLGSHAASPPPVGSSVVIQRVVPLTQEADYVEGGPFPAEAHEASLDRVIAIAQQQQDELDRCLKSDLLGSEVTYADFVEERVLAEAARDAAQTAAEDAAALASASKAALASMPAYFARSFPLAAKTVTNSWDRYALIPWSEFGVNLWGTGLYKAGAPEMYLDNAAWWDSIVTTDYTVAANRAGKDFYVYACNIGVVAPKIVLSPNATIPVGYTAGNSRLLGGFHCLCANVGTISGHALTGYLAGDILPASVWDQLHRPISSPAGMVYASGIGKWVDIYLPSLSGGALASVYHGTIADGAGATTFDWYMFAEFFGRIGKRMLTQSEFMAASVGVAGWASVTGATDPIVTGGHLDSNGIRIVSNIGCEDCCGVMWQWVGETAGQYETSASYIDQKVTGSWLSGYALNVPRRGLVGGDYSSGGNSGALCARWETWPSYCGASMTSRGLSDPI